MTKNLRITITDRELAEILNYYKKILKSCLNSRIDYKHDSGIILKCTDRIQHLIRIHMKHCKNE